MINGGKVVSEPQYRLATVLTLVVPLRRTSLHRALYLGHLSAAALLLDAGAQLSIQDFKVHLSLPLASPLHIVHLKQRQTQDF